MEYSETGVIMDNNMTMTLLPEHSGSDYTDNTSDIEDSPTQLGIKVFSGVSMSLVILITILGNLLVISAVFKFRSLRTMNNCFIVSLAVADLLVGLIVQPLNMYNEMAQGKWNLGRAMCNVYNSNDVFFTTASLLHLCCISCDRYIAILHPFVYERAITKFRVAMMIGASWIISGLLSYMPICIGWYTTAEDLRAQQADPHRCNFEVSRPYAFISSSVSFWIPTIVMVVFYQRILSTALRQEKQIRALMRPPAPKALEEESKEPMLNGDTTNNNQSNHSISEDGQTLTSSEDQEYSADAKLNNVSNGHKVNGRKKSTKSTSNAKKDLKQMKKLRKEHRAAKTLGIIMGSFILCMGPIFLWYTITFGMCPVACRLSAKHAWVITLVFWIGYINSLMNPIIYAFFNRDFQVAFKRLFATCRKNYDQRQWRRHSMSSDTPATPPSIRQYRGGSQSRHRTHDNIITPPSIPNSPSIELNPI